MKYCYLVDFGYHELKFPNRYTQRIPPKSFCYVTLNTVVRLNKETLILCLKPYYYENNILSTYTDTIIINPSVDGREQKIKIKVQNLTDSEIILKKEDEIFDYVLIKNSGESEYYDNTKQEI